MRLSECRFYCGGQELNFSMFSDGVCRAKHIHSIAMRLLGEVGVDVYEIVPASASHWVVVSQSNGDEMSYRWFVREDETFLEREDWDVPDEVRNDVVCRFPHLPFPLPRAA
jgi:hypothetical protein